MSIKRYCDSCNNIIKSDYKKLKVKVENVQRDGTNNYKWKKLDVCINCYNKLFPPAPQFSVELDNVKDSTLKRIVSGQGLKPINDIVSIENGLDL